VHIGSRLEFCQREPQALRNIHFTHIAISSTYGIRGILANPQNGEAEIAARFRASARLQVGALHASQQALI
jgi:hypothetical protein